MTTFTEEDFEKAMEEAGEELEAGKKEEEPKGEEEAAGEEETPKSQSQSPRLADDESIPAELRGKSVEEALAIYGQLKQTSQGLARQFQEMNKKPAEQPKPPAPITADDLVEGDGQGFNQKLEEFFNAKITPLQQTLLQTAAQNNRQAMVGRSPILQKYENTLNAIIQEHSLGHEALARPDVWAQLEMMVAQRHFDDIVRERAAAIQKPTPEPSEKGTGTPEADGQQVKLTAQEKAVADGMGVSYKAYAQMKRFTQQG